MKRSLNIVFALACGTMLHAQSLQQVNTAGQVVASTTVTEEKRQGDGFVWMTEQFADIGVLRYIIPGWDKLTHNQRLLVYYLTEAGYAGRDIIWDQNYRYNLTIRQALEHIFKNYTGDRNSKEWQDFMVYTKRVWFSNGIHHHYGMDKIKPGCSKEYFTLLVKINRGAAFARYHQHYL